MHNSTQNTTIHQSSGFAKSARDFIRRISPGIFIFMKSVYIFALHVISKGRWKKTLKQDMIKLNLGSGPREGENGWSNVDYRTFDPLLDHAKQDFESMYIKASK